MAVRDVRVVSIPISDPERAKSFYVDQLGLRLEREDTSIPGIHWIQVQPEGSTTALTLVTWFDTMPAGSLQGLVLTCDDLQADYEQLLSRGVTFESPPQQNPWGAEAVLRDPDGNRIVLQQA
jgi:catechol 2,3-dioxygenase-like lactoylglutathione lyase family enzyme